MARSWRWRRGRPDLRDGDRDSQISQEGGLIRCCTHLKGAVAEGEPRGGAIAKESICNEKPLAIEGKLGGSSKCRTVVVAPTAEVSRQNKTILQRLLNLGIITNYDSRTHLILYQRDAPYCFHA